MRSSRERVRAPGALLGSPPVLSFSSCCPGVACSGTDPTWKCVCNLSGYHSRTIYDVAWCVAAWPCSPPFPLVLGGAGLTPCTAPLQVPPHRGAGHGLWRRRHPGLRGELLVHAAAAHLQPHRPRAPRALAGRQLRGLEPQGAGAAGLLQRRRRDRLLEVPAARSVLRALPRGFRLRCWPQNPLLRRAGRGQGGQPASHLPAALGLQLFGSLRLGGLAGPERSLPAVGVLPRSPGTRTVGQPPCQAQGDTPRALLLPPALCSINPRPARSLRLSSSFLGLSPPRLAPGGAGQGVRAALGLGEAGEGGVVHPITHSSWEVWGGCACLLLPETATGQLLGPELTSFPPAKPHSASSSSWQLALP